MPTFARAGSGKWHVVGPDGCRYGREFATEDRTPDETVTATDIVAYESPTAPENSQPSEATPRSLGETLFPRGHTHDQRLVLPAPIEESDSDLCRSCRSTLETHQKRRSRVIADCKQVTPRRDLEWERTERETYRACDWCRAHERTTHDSDALGATICPACRRLFEGPLGEPTNGNAPDADHRPETPDEPVTPIVFGTELPEYDPTELVGSNRPLIKYREKHTYAELVVELERTGHGLSAAGIAALEAVRDDYADAVADDNAHQADVRLEVATTPRTVTLEGILPSDRVDVITDCLDIASKPAYWVPLGWPEQGYIHRRAADPAVPGDDLVVEEFPRLETRQPASSVDTETLRSLTEPGRYQRGERYYEQGAVTDVKCVDDVLQATVQGSRPYDVRVTLSSGSYVEGRCGCPDDATPCKHIVAAVLASGDVDSIGSEQSLEAILESASAAELRSLLRTLAEDDLTVRTRIYEELS